MSVDWLDPELLSVALCWRLERRDGGALGFTTHDRDLTVGGLRYRAAPGLLPSAISLSEGFDVDGLDLSGALSSAAIAAQDLESGRWDGARVAIFAVDWRDSGGEALPITRGEIGDVTTRDDAFTAELRGLTALLEAPVVERTSPECRAELGDRRCRIDLAPRTRMVRVTAVVAADRFEVDMVEPLANIYGYGRAQWLSGPNTGLYRPILVSDGAEIVLRELPSFAVAEGDLLELVEGCDKSFATCCTRFANAINFRGEPHLPGMDLLTRYPGA